MTNKTGSYKEQKYIPALLFNFLTPFYDIMVNLGIPVSSLNNEIINSAEIRDNHSILDIGCGTGTLVIEIKKRYPMSEVTGLDGDPKILNIAGGKIKKRQLDIKLVEGMSYSLPCADNTFDRVFSSLMSHHLNHENKARTFSEAFRVLKPGGEFLLFDIGKPQNFFMSVLSQFLDFFEEASENVKGLLPEMMEKTGFSSTGIIYTRSTIIGSLSLIKGHKTATSPSFGGQASHRE